MVENRRRIGLAGVIISLLLVAALMGGCAANAASAAPPPAARTTLTAEQLEAQYGLRVNLLALTAAGGMVDLRLTVTDAAKAAALLGNLSPALGVSGSAVVLRAPDDGLPQEKPEDGKLLFRLFPNSGNAVKRGTKVAVTFGDISLQPLPVQ